MRLFSKKNTINDSVELRILGYNILYQQTVTYFLAFPQNGFIPSKWVYWSFLKGYKPFQITILYGLLFFSKLKTFSSVLFFNFLPFFVVNLAHLLSDVYIKRTSFSNITSRV